jgi:hypothetical protein
MGILDVPKQNYQILYVKCNYACSNLFIVMLNVIILSFVMLNVVAPHLMGLTIQPTRVKLLSGAPLSRH